MRVFYAKKNCGGSYRPDNGKAVNITMFILLGITFLGQLTCIFYAKMGVQFFANEKL